MAVVRAIGKNTLGDNDKMKVAMREYEMSTHDLSFVFRNTQAPGTLVPFMKIPAQTLQQHQLIQQRRQLS